MDPYAHFHHYMYMQERRRERAQRHPLAELREVHLVSPLKRVLARLRALFKKPGASRPQRDIAAPLEAAASSSEERLSHNGFTEEEIAAFRRLKQWYQMRNEQDTAMLRHWEFLRLLVNSGKLEV